MARELATIILIGHPYGREHARIIRKCDKMVGFAKIFLSSPDFNLLAVEWVPGVIDFDRSRIMGSVC